MVAGDQVPPLPCDSNPGRLHDLPADWEAGISLAASTGPAKSMLGTGISRVESADTATVRTDGQYVGCLV